MEFQRPKKSFRLVGILGLIALISAACGTAADPEGGVADDPEVAVDSADDPANDAPADAGGCLVPGSELTIVNLDDGVSVNPILAADPSSEIRTDWMFDQLVELDPNTMEVVPSLAHDWDVSDDGTTYTFYLEEDVYFHDGEQVTADDVAFTIDQMLLPEYEGPFLADMRAIEGGEERLAGESDEVSGVDVIDDHTISISLATPDAAWLPLVGQHIKPLPSHLLEGQGAIDADHDFSSNPIGSGPYEFVEWLESERFTAVATGDYWRPNRGCFETIHHIGIAETETLLVAMETGEAHVTDMTPPEAMARMAALPHLTLQVVDSPRPDGVFFNLNHEVLAVPEVREAIMLAVDQHAFTESFLGEFAEVAPGWGHPNSWAFDSTAVVPVDQDLERAAALLDEAGYGEGFEIEIYSNDNPNREGLAVYMQEVLSGLGIEVSVRSSPWTTFIGDIQDGNFEINIQAAEAGFIDPSGMEQTYHSDGGGNYMSYSDPEVDEWFESARVIDDTEERAEYYGMIQQRLSEAVPFFPVYWRPQTSLYNHEVLDPDTVQPSGLRNHFDVRQWRPADN